MKYTMAMLMLAATYFPLVIAIERTANAIGEREWSKYVKNQAIAAIFFWILSGAGIAAIIAILSGG